MEARISELEARLLASDKAWRGERKARARAEQALRNVYVNWSIANYIESLVCVSVFQEVSRLNDFDLGQHMRKLSHMTLSSWCYEITIELQRRHLDQLESCKMIVSIQSGHAPMLVVVIEVKRIRRMNQWVQAFVWGQSELCNRLSQREMEHLVNLF